MKKFILITVTLLGLSLSSWSQLSNVHISGIVTELNSNTPIANQTVTIMSDSIFGPTYSYYNQVYTDTMGYYEVWLYCPVNMQVLFYISVIDCQGAYHYQTGVNTNSPIIANFSICNNPVSICQASFNWVPDTSNPSQFYMINFYDNSAGNPISWQWSFGDGTGSNLQNPIHGYLTPGVYTVCLTIAGANGCTSVSCNSITVGNPPPQPCNADFIYYQDTNALNSFHFICTNPANTYQYLWDFGDGTTATSMDPYHTFAQQGTYMVCLTVTNFNCQDTWCDTIIVGTNPNPCSNFITYSTQGTTVHFVGHALGGTAPYTYLWNFGDGTTAITHDPVHNYVQPGTYTVTLVTTDANGCTYTSTITITVSIPSTVSIWGVVWAGNTLLDNGWAYLYYGGQGTILTLLDSNYIDSAGIYQFNNVAAIGGHYFVKAFPSSNSAFYSDYLPTYYGHTLYWANATPIIATQLVNPYNIELIHAIFPSQGNGNINGQVTTGNKSFSANGAPAPDVEVLLLNYNNQALAIDYSDASGYFSFSDLAMGTYKLYAEVTGLETTPAIITLSANNPSVNNASIIITSTGVITNIHEEVPGILSIHQLFPNPASDYTYIDLSLEKSTNLNINLFNIIGNKVLSIRENYNAGSQRLSINLQNIIPGTYILQIISPEGSYYYNKVTVIR